MIIKNILSVELTMPKAGIVLNPSETITYEEIGNSDFLASCSDEITSFVVLEKIKVFEDDEITEVTVTNVAVHTSGEKQTLSLGNLDELASAMSPHANRKFIFLKDVFTLKKNRTIKKPFPGSISSVSVRPKNGSVSVQLFSDGIYFQEEEISKNAIFEFDFDYKMTDTVLMINDSSSNKNEIEIYIDGDTYLDSLLIQELVDGWQEDSASHSDIDKYMFDE